MQCQTLFSGDGILIIEHSAEPGGIEIGGGEKFIEVVKQSSPAAVRGVSGDFYQRFGGIQHCIPSAHQRCKIASDQCTGPVLADSIDRRTLPVAAIRGNSGDTLLITQ